MGLSCSAEKEEEEGGGLSRLRTFESVATDSPESADESCDSEANPEETLVFPNPTAPNEAFAITKPPVVIDFDTSVTVVQSPASTSKSFPSTVSICPESGNKIWTCAKCRQEIKLGDGESAGKSNAVKKHKKKCNINSKSLT